MQPIVNLLMRINLISQIFDLGVKVYDKLKKPKADIKPTTTDLILSALDLADKIAFDMETVKLTLNSIIADDTRKGISALDKLKEKFVEYGFNSAIWDQFVAWNNNAEFGWSSFRDELKILVGECMTPEQKKDIVTYKVNKNTHKIKIQK